MLCRATFLSEFLISVRIDMYLAQLYLMVQAWALEFRLEFEPPPCQFTLSL